MNPAAGVTEYSPLSSISDDEPTAVQPPQAPHWADGLSPVSTDSQGHECGDTDISGLSLQAIGNRPVPAKLFLKDDDHLLQIQVCWACRLELCRTADKQLMRIGGADSPALKIPHFVVSSWSDVASAIQKDNGVEARQMVFWLKQSVFEEGPASSSLSDTASTATTSASCFDTLCGSSAEEYAKATDLQSSPIFPVEEACLRCRRPALLPVILDDFIETRLAVQSALMQKRKLLQDSPVLASAPSTPFSRPTTTDNHNNPVKRHLTESPPDHRKPVLNLFNAIGLSDWRPRQYNTRQYGPRSSNNSGVHWSPGAPTTAESPKPPARRHIRRQAGRRKQLNGDYAM